MWYDWRKYHQCERFEKLDEQGRCVFCRLNDELIMKGYEALPYDVPGPYKGKGELPDIILQPLRDDQNNEPS
jgi:hypothetical protein